MNILRKRAQKVKKHNNFTFHDYLPQCASFALKRETNFKLQRYLSPRWKLEKSMINVKT